MIKCLLLLCAFSLSSCTLFSTRTDSTKNTNMVSEETTIREEYHDGQIMQLKTTSYKTQVTKEVAQIKSSVNAPVVSTGLSLTSMLGGGGAGVALLGYLGNKLRNMQPPAPKPQPERVKGRREDEGYS